MESINLHMAAKLVTDKALFLSIDDGLMYWKARANDTEDTKSPEENSYWYYQPNAADIETTAYALLTMLAIGDRTQTEIVQEALPIARWLSRQRNAWGGFASTQV